MLSWRSNYSKSHPKSIILPSKRVIQSSWRILTLLQCIHITLHPSWLSRRRTTQRRTMTTYPWRLPVLSKLTRWWHLISSPRKSDSCSLPNSHSHSPWAGTCSTSRLQLPMLHHLSSHALAVSNFSISSIRTSQIIRQLLSEAVAIIPSATSPNPSSSQAWTCQCQIGTQTVATRLANRLLPPVASSREQHRSQTIQTMPTSLSSLKAAGALQPTPSSRSTWSDCSMARIVERLSWFVIFPTSTLKKCSWSASTDCTKADMTFSTCLSTWTMAAILDMRSLISWTLSTLSPSLKTWTISLGSPSTRRRSARSPLEESKANATCWRMWASSQMRARFSPWFSRFSTSEARLSVLERAWWPRSTREDFPCL